MDEGKRKDETCFINEVLGPEYLYKALGVEWKKKKKKKNIASSKLVAFLSNMGFGNLTNGASPSADVESPSPKHLCRPFTQSMNENKSERKRRNLLLASRLCGLDLLVQVAFPPFFFSPLGGFQILLLYLKKKGSKRSVGSLVFFFLPFLIYSLLLLLLHFSAIPLHLFFYRLLSSYSICVPDVGQRSAESLLQSIANYLPTNPTHTTSLGLNTLFNRIFN